MQLTSHISLKEDNVADYQRTECLPKDADDSTIAAMVAQAEMPPLLAALALATGDPELLREDLVPPLPPMGATIQPHGGMSDKALEDARQIATGAIASLRDSGDPSRDEPTDEVITRVMAYLTKGASEDHKPLLRHELGIQDYGAPTWSKDEVAPGIDFRVAVIGSGISGLGVAYRLLQAGLDFTVFEKNQEVGGTWWENIYPGCRLDTPQFAYSYSFAQKTNWSEYFSPQPEIQDYLADVASNFDIRSHIKFNTEVVAASFNDHTMMWHVVTENHKGVRKEYTFHAIISAVGQLNLPHIPEIPGARTFQGQAFHSAQWDATVDLTGKNVVVIGSGASAFQIVPAIADTVSNLTVFQRNAPWMLPTPTYHSPLPEGMQWLLRHIPYYGRCLRFWQFWQAAEGRMPFVTVDPEWQSDDAVSELNAQLRRELLEVLQEQVGDHPDLLQKMTPRYPPGAKRLLRDNGVWSKTLKKPNVVLETSGIQKIAPEGVVDNEGSLHPADVIVYATGFRASDYLEPIKVRGAAGRDLHEYWDGDARAYMGVNVPGFPNLFMIMGPNSGVVVN
ncbi:NAD(P)/FAD-dependent oxidoreductase, partial [Auritidibacter ignavus]|uniref:flavin-containing monooxygenase n=1 Tax=Auritidibacter ignavus TaxID=678932 RepID=UPI002FE65369